MKSARWSRRSNSMKLYTSVGPNPRVARMFAAEKGIALDLAEIDILAGDNR